MICLVNDANILIDLLKLNLLDTFFQLEYDFQVTDIVLSEVQEENIAELNSYVEHRLLIRQGFDFEELMQIQLLEVETPALSIADCSCLFLARKLSATLLTGDGALRQIAVRQGLVVHGVLWVFDQLITKGVLSQKDGREKLLMLMDVNQRLPLVECHKRLKVWGRNS